MRKELGKALREIFTAEMKRACPQFAPAKLASQYLFPGERVFRWVPEEPHHLFVILVPGRTGGDEFTVEIGWSSEGRFPELGMRPSASPSDERKELGERELVCRLSSLWTSEDLWWPLSDFDPMDPESQMRAILASATPLSAGEAREAVEPRVREAVEKLASLGIPYLEEYLEAATSSRRTDVG